MKCMGVLLLSFLIGCAPVTTLEELEAQAYVSGDWSEVEKRERIIARREARKGPTCPGSAVAVCERRVGGQRCNCVSRDALRDMLSGWR